MLVTKQFVSQWLPLYFCLYYRSQWDWNGLDTNILQNNLLFWRMKLFGYQILQNILCCVPQKKGIPTFYRYIQDTYKYKILWWMLVTKQFCVPLTSIVFFGHTIEDNGNVVYQDIFCAPEKKSNAYRFGTTLGWVNHDMFLILGGLCL